MRAVGQGPDNPNIHVKYCSRAFKYLLLHYYLPIYLDKKKDLSEYMYCYKCDSYISFIYQKRPRFRDQKFFFALQGNFRLTRQFGLNISNVKIVLNW